MLGKVIRLIKRSDLIVEVLDAREPSLTRSKKIENISIKNSRKILLVLNKGDLVPLWVLRAWKNYFKEEENIESVYMSATSHLGTKLLRDTMKSILKGDKGIVVFVGYPKSGKSSIINALKGKHSAQTSAHPLEYGYTKSLQLFKIDKKIYAWDTPGVIPPDGDELEKIIRGSNVDLLEDPVKPALILINRIIEFSKESLIHVYKVDFSNPYELLEKIAIKRGWFYKSTKEPNIDMAAKAIIRDYHEGKIAYYTLPPSLYRDD
ncbi:LSU ribosomal maturation GTPase RbgA [Saccharolobus shibatae B12]|uniref:LSU ribosomal maturation GTPase RbgA n=1 Tax=Saccharolobus shibatae (strain ATCC 51178 / DSM 5389 / JCM 8931 / NBRC 15437 / B12) TaxID=523848 RepID=A0A8F5BRF2_SACSH|nr:GTPase [Saccharolobus shibatae]QXJ29933.1 LSU ribosomal maturation GTPase RbgA [Saccharolobus shibatae B12]